MPLRFCVAALLVALVGSSVGADEPKRGPFQQPPRNVRSRDFDVEHLRLELTPDWDRREIQARATHALAPFRATDRLRFDQHKLHVERATLKNASGDDRDLKFEVTSDGVEVSLDRVYQPGESLTLAVDYKIAQPERGAHFVVPDEDEPRPSRVLWTQCQPDDARAWIPTFDSPNERLTSETLVTVPETYFVLSNGVLKSRQTSDGKTTYHWVQEQPHSPYLISVVAGEFEAFEQSWDGIPVVSYVPPDRMADAPRSFEKTPEMVKLFSEKIGVRYPWPKYAQIACDEYGGGMEHTSATTLGLNTLHDERAHLDVSSDDLVAHELAHQWWGDYLTCKDWAELWLNESFATYFATVWCEHDLGADEAAWDRRGQAEAYRNEDRNRYRRPIVTYRYDESNYMFDSHSYPKGSRVLHMLRYVLGEDDFWKALNHYCTKHAHGVVETADFRVAIEEQTGQSLNGFFDQWIYHGGHPEYEVSYQYDSAGRQLRLTVKQVQKVDDLTPLFRMPIEVEIATPRETRIEKIDVAKAEETYTFACDERPTRVVFDPRDWVLKSVKFDRSKQELLDQLARDEHMMARDEAATALAEFKPDADAREALARAAEHDAFWGVRKTAAESLARFPDSAAVLRRVARQDKKSAVRRAALKALGDVHDDETRTVLREAIAQDPSYYCAADALGALVKADRDHVRDDLLAALERPSHNECILEAACDGLVEIKAADAKERLLALARPPSKHQRRSAVMMPLARLAGDDPQVIELLGQQLDDSRGNVVYRAAMALAETGAPAALDKLQAARQRAQKPRVLRGLDDAIAKLKDGSDVAKLRRDVDELRARNKELLSRIESLENKGAKLEAGQ